jgi:hypothetical protein
MNKKQKEGMDEPNFTDLHGGTIHTGLKINHNSARTDYPHGYKGYVHFF